MAESCDQIEPNGALPPIAAAIIRSAASGDLAAQRRIRQAWCDRLDPARPAGANDDMMAASGLFVARMCAANGDHSDAQMLATLLLTAGARLHDSGRVPLGWEFIAESLSLYERMSAAGDVEATDIVDDLVPTLPCEVVARAQFYARREKEASDASTNPEA
ncbi:hypothetical protein GRI40_08955 [Altererythrobacter aerius]|uniref:Uncharacterized protein n=1 Tax=Tsuneonella aeria TaxID=1837929 RepID=A0A6I4TH48_9SPHN|nr:hypothetical protein [Tsuneonella aeria]MXO75340.1 hypothetical protein [Tsuneonella aeria]